jgi:hypothetical protein
MILKTLILRSPWGASSQVCVEPIRRSLRPFFSLDEVDEELDAVTVRLFPRDVAETAQTMIWRLIRLSQKDWIFYVKTPKDARLLSQIKGNLTSRGAGND